LSRAAAESLASARPNESSWENEKSGNHIHHLDIPSRAFLYVSPRLGFLRVLKGVFINDTASPLAFLRRHNFDPMILQKYSRFVDGTIPVAALLYDDEEIYASQDGVGIYDG
jgi:hypothetical protein